MREDNLRYRIVAFNIKPDRITAIINIMQSIVCNSRLRYTLRAGILKRFFFRKNIKIIK